MTLSKAVIDSNAVFDIRSLTDDLEFDLPWQMTKCERLALQALLQRLRPALSLDGRVTASIDTSIDTASITGCGTIAATTGGVTSRSMTTVHRTA
jgi:hypothetical protein